MAITHKFDNAYTITDYTEEVNLVPNEWSLISDQNIFQVDMVGTNSVTFDKSEQFSHLVNDKRWGERSTFASNDKTELHTFAIPTFPLDDLITVGDVWNKRMVGTADMQEAVDNVMMKKLAQIRKSHAITQEKARAEAIKGYKYAPNSTIPTANWYNEFGVSQLTVDFDFDNITASDNDVRQRIQDVVAHIQDEFKGAGILNEVTFYCSPKFFERLISNNQVEAAYQNYASSQEPLRNDLRVGLYREFVFQGVRFIEYRGSDPTGALFFPDYDTDKDGANAPRDDSLDPEGRAYAVASGTSSMIEYYAPAYRLDTVGQMGAENYLWTYEDIKSSNIEIMSETNFLYMNQRPEIVVRCVGGDKS